MSSPSNCSSVSSSVPTHEQVLIKERISFTCAQDILVDNNAKNDSCESMYVFLDYDHFRSCQCHAEFVSQLSNIEWTTDRWWFGSESNRRDISTITSISNMGAQTKFPSVWLSFTIATITINISTLWIGYVRILFDEMINMNFIHFRTQYQEWSCNSNESVQIRLKVSLLSLLVKTFMNKNKSYSLYLDRKLDRIFDKRLISPCTISYNPSSVNDALARQI